jgi:putative transposase
MLICFIIGDFLDIVKLLFILPGSPWENSEIESFNGKFRDELLNLEIYYTLKET